MARTDHLKVWASLLTAFCVATVFAIAALAGGAEAREAGCKGQVVLDAGHGGSDSGAVNARYGLKEKEPTLDVVRRLEVLLESDGHAVCMTRTGDETLSNSDRYAYANTTGAEILVSVHMNGSSDPNTDYTTTLFGKWRKDKELALTVFDGLAALPAADGTGTIAKKNPTRSPPACSSRARCRQPSRRPSLSRATRRDASSPTARAPASSR